MTASEIYYCVPTPTPLVPFNIFRSLKTLPVSASPHVFVLFYIMGYKRGHDNFDISFISAKEISLLITCELMEFNVYFVEMLLHITLMHVNIGKRIGIFIGE